MGSRKWGTVRGNGKKVALCFGGGRKAYICRRKVNRLGRTVFRLEGLWELYEERLELSVNSELLSLGVPSIAFLY